MSDMIRLAFVCTGNICRSPLAESLARHRLVRAGLHRQFALESFGTHDYHVGEGADRRTVATAQGFDVDVSAHRARRIEPADIDRFDLVFAMAGEHERHLSRLAPAALQDRIHLYLPFVGIETPRDVPDPYYGDAAGFADVHRLLDRAGQGLVARLPAWLADRRG